MNPKNPRNPETLNPSSKLAYSKYNHSRKKRSVATTLTKPKFQYTSKDFQPKTNPLTDFSRRDLIGAVFYSDLIILNTLNQLYPALL